MALMAFETRLQSEPELQDLLAEWGLDSQATQEIMNILQDGTDLLSRLQPYYQALGNHVIEFFHEVHLQQNNIVVETSLVIDEQVTVTVRDYNSFSSVVFGHPKTEPNSPWVVIPGED